MKRINLKLPDFLTISNLVLGFLSIYFSANGRFVFASLFLLFALIFDIFDGKLARWLKVSSEMGKQLDSLSDMVSFGVAVPFLIISYFGYNIISLIFGLLYVISGTYRLARFNVLNQNSFYGLPIPFGAILFPLLILFGFNNEIIFYFLMLIITILMSSKIRIRKF